MLALSNIHTAGTSIQPGSMIDIKGPGRLTLPGDFSTVLSNYVSNGRIVGYGGSGTVQVVLDVTVDSTNTVATATPGGPAPTTAVWNPAANPNNTDGLWSDATNWNGGAVPGNTTEVFLNVPGAIPCQVTSLASAARIVTGDTGAGGTLIVTNGALLNVGAAGSSAIGQNQTGTLQVESGASANFGGNLYVGHEIGADGLLTVNGGTVSVAGEFGLGWYGGKGTAHIHGGTLNLSQMFLIQGSSVLDVAGTGRVVISGDQYYTVEYLVSVGQVTANGGTNVAYVYEPTTDKTIIAAEYISPAQAVWNPGAIADPTGVWNDGANWTGGRYPGSTTKAVFNVAGAIDCLVTNAVTTGRVVMGDNGPGGMLIVTNGGNLVVGAVDWSAVNYNYTSATATLVIEDGASASFGHHLWIGQQPGANGVLVMNGGTVSVGQMFGLGFGGGTGTAHINGGTLNLAQWNDTQSISGVSTLDVAGLGKVVINGDHSTSVGNYIAAGKITANGGPNVFYGYDSGANKTTISAVMLSAPRQSITAVTVSDGTVSITYETTAQHTYHLESTPSVAPAVWTPVAGSTNVATGAPVTFTFPVSGEQSFYRTVSP